MYSTPADWGMTEPMLTVLFSYQEKAIVLSDNGELFYSEMPEEYIIKKEAGYGKRALYSVLWLDSSAEETGCSV